QELHRTLKSGPRFFRVAQRLSDVRCAELASRTRLRGGAGAKRGRTLVPVRCLGGVAAVPPEAPDCPGQHQRALAVAPVTRIPERLADVVVLERKPVVPLPLVRPGEVRLRLEDEGEEKVEVAIADIVELFARLEQVARELPDRLEHEEASLADRLKEVQIHEGRDFV